MTIKEVSEKYDLSADTIRYYERIGLHYTLPRTGGIKVGANVKAHLTKADFTELVVTVPISIQRKTTPRHN